MWVKTKRLSSRIELRAMHPVPEEHEKVKWHVYDIVEDKRFDNFIILCIVLNAICMCIYHYEMDETLATFLVAMDILFIIIFTMEAVTFKINHKHNIAVDTTFFVVV